MDANLSLSERDRELTRISLVSDFNKRCQRNSAYSLRAFAKCLGISHATLSLIFNGKRLPSKRICQNLKKEYGLTFESGRKSPEQSTHELSQAEFDTIASWVHYAILGLAAFPGYDADPATTGKALGISATETANAISTLKKLGFLTQTQNGWVQSTPPLRLNLKTSTERSKDYIRGLLTKAEASLDKDNNSERDHTSITFSMRTEDVEEAKKHIAAFRRGLCKNLESRNGVDRVYTLSVQLFPLSEKLIRGIGLRP